MENNKKIAFDFKPSEEQELQKKQSTKLGDFPNEELVTVKEETEKSIEDSTIENIEPISEIELLKEEKDRDISTKQVKLHKPIEYEYSEDYIPVSLPGNVEEKKNVDFKTTLKQLKDKFENNIKLEPITVDKKDLKVSIVSFIVIIAICILIYLSGTLVYERYIKKEEEVVNEIINVYVDEDMPYYHYENCQHLKKDKRYIKLEEDIAKQLGYTICK